MQCARNVQRKFRKLRLELGVILGHHLEAAAHGADRRVELVAVGIFECFAPGLSNGCCPTTPRPRTSCYRALASVMIPVARDQLSRDSADILDGSLAYFKGSIGLGCWLAWYKSQSASNSAWCNSAQSIGDLRACVQESQ